MNSESDLVVGLVARLPLPLRDLVAVLATARLVSTQRGPSLPRMWFDPRRGSRAGAASGEPQHDRLRPRAWIRGAPGTGRDPAGPGPRGSLRRRRAPVPALR